RTSACTAACAPSAARPGPGTCRSSCCWRRTPGLGAATGGRRRRHERRSSRSRGFPGIVIPAKAAIQSPSCRVLRPSGKPLDSRLRGNNVGSSVGAWASECAGGMLMTPAHAPIESVNDFVVKFANVNGSGSASANELFAKAILRMGVPVSPRNIFPSNIQGLPTWYEVRVSERGWLGRRGGMDLMVAMNPQTWDADVAESEPGGYLFHDSRKPLPKSKFRDDITVIGVPLTQICNATWDDPRQRQLFKNIMYVGALSALLDIDPAVIETLIGEQYKTKPKLQQPNLQALHLGRDWVR